MYDETFNPDDLESKPEDDLEEVFKELDIEFPTPKEKPSLDEMMRRYGLTIIEFSMKSIKHDQGFKK